MKSALTLFLASLFSLFMLTGCNTFEGMGEDAETASEEIEDTVEDID